MIVLISYVYSLFWLDLIRLKADIYTHGLNTLRTKYRVTRIKYNWHLLDKAGFVPSKQDDIKQYQTEYIYIHKIVTSYICQMSFSPLRT